MLNSFFDKRNLCPCCKSKNHILIFKCGFLDSPIRDYLTSFYSTQGEIDFEYLKDEKFIINKCIDCGLIFQLNIPNNFLMKKLYSEWIDPEKDFNQRIMHFNLDYYARIIQEIMMIISYFRKIPSQIKMLDYGMGWGKWCQIAKSFGCDVYGSELESTRIDFAKRHGIKMVEPNVLPDYQFDFINTEQVFEHLPYPLETLEYLKNLLNAEGIIKISVPNTHGMKRKLKKMDWKAPKGSYNSINPIHPLEHINCFCDNSLVIMARKIGLRPVKIPLRFGYIFFYCNSAKQAIKSLVKPLYRKYFLKNTYVFFIKEC